MHCPRRVISLWIALLLGWGLALGLGFVLLGAYAARPGDPGAPQKRWPRSSALVLDERRSNLLIFLHPACPCSQASIEELAYVMARSRGRVRAQAVLVVPETVPKRWALGKLEKQLSELPDLVVRRDTGGTEQKRFGAATSGHVLLYDNRGRLVFSGGITPARGHVGPSYGRDALVAYLQSNSSEQPASPVFGCPLTTPRSAVSKELSQ
jgi:hypothetical protein